jgi:hypothetical protein
MKKYLQAFGVITFLFVCVAWGGLMIGGAG